MPRSWILKTFAILLNASTVAAITACPVQETIYTAANGVQYRICPNTDLQGPSFQIVNQISSLNACAQLCEKSSKCVKAVYDHQASVCHVKEDTATLTWATDGRFDVVRMDTDLSQGTVISSCPFPQTSYTASGGAKWLACPGSDYRGPSRQVVRGISSTSACYQLCQKTTGCIKAVFDNRESVCHIKDDSATLIWALNKRFDVIRLDNSNPASPATLGKWSDIVRFPVIPVAAYVVPQQPDSSRLLMFSSWGTDTFGGATGYTQFADYNFKTGAVSQRTVSNTKHDMFCPGISALADGRIIITGGSNAEATSLYDPSTNAFIRGPDMKIARGYQTSATLPNGKVFTIGGSYSGPRGGKNGEIYDPVANTWTLLPQADVTPMLTTDAEGNWRTDNHGWLMGWRNGAVFQLGPSKTMHWYGTSGSGSVTNAGTRDSNADAMCGVWVMFDAVAGKIFSAGGSQDYTNSPATARAHLTTIGNPNTAASVVRLPDMQYPRAFANAVVLPDGTVLVTGGQKKALVFTDIDSWLVPELFNPTTKSFKSLAPASVPRNYHSVSLLLPDGTVFSGGGGLCYVGGPGGNTANCDRSVDHADGQIFSPPYLFKSDGTAATRPVISSLSSSTSSSGASVPVGGTLTVTMSTASSGTTFSLVRLGSATHSVNSDQRRVPLTNTSANGAKYTMRLPNDSGVLIPGFYYLFAISKDGVPSIAKTVKVTL